VVRPLGTEFLSGPPIGSLEYQLLPVEVRRGFLKSVCAEAMRYRRTIQALDHLASDEQRTRIERGRHH